MYMTVAVVNFYLAGTYFFRSQFYKIRRGGRDWDFSGSGLRKLVNGFSRASNFRIHSPSYRGIKLILQNLSFKILLLKK